MYLHFFRFFKNILELIECRRGDPYMAKGCEGCVTWRRGALKPLQPISRMSWYYSQLSGSTLSIRGLTAREFPGNIKKNPGFSFGTGIRNPTASWHHRIINTQQAPLIPMADPLSLIYSELWRWKITEFPDITWRYGANWRICNPHSSEYIRLGGLAIGIKVA